MCAGVVGRARAPQLADHTARSLHDALREPERGVEAEAPGTCDADGDARAAEEQLELEAAVTGEEAVAEAGP